MVKIYNKMNEGKDIVYKDYLEDLISQIKDNDTIYDDKPVKNDIKDLKDSLGDVNRLLNELKTKQDKHIETVDKEETPNSVVLKFRLNDGTEKTVEVPKSQYNDTSIKQRLSALESKPDKDTVYNDNSIKQRLTTLEQKQDKDTKYTAGKGISITGTTISTKPTEYILPLTAPIYLRDKGNGEYGYAFRGFQFLAFVKTHIALVLGKSYESITSNGGSVHLYSNNLRISLSSNTYEFLPQIELVDKTSPKIIYYTFTLKVTL